MVIIITSCVCVEKCVTTVERGNGWSFEVMKSNTLLIDVIEGNLLKLSSSTLLFLLHGHPIGSRQHCHICYPVAKWNRKGVVRRPLNRLRLLHVPSLEAAGGGWLSWK